MDEKVSMLGKIAFVAPWFGEKIPGGSEMEARELSVHLHDAGVNIEILTTCVKDFTSDWSINYHEPGCYTELGLNVRRFAVKRRDDLSFNKVNIKLMEGIVVPPDEQQIYIDEMVNSPDLYAYISEHKGEYSLFVFIPYMFGTTYYGIKQCPEKSVLIPCFHEEAYVHMDIYKLYESIAGLIYNAAPEMELANSIFSFSENTKQAVLGIGIDDKFSGDGEAFRRKYKIEDPFILYAGRKDAGKNIGLLMQYFYEYRIRNASSKTKLVLIGGGKLKIPKAIKDYVVDLGFVDVQDKYNAYKAATLLCQPSVHESFSLVIMEAWLAGCPVLVHADCAVTKDFASSANAGLYFKDYYEFEGCVNYLLQHPEKAEMMGENGRKYVAENYTWDVVVDRYIDFLTGIIE